MKFKEEIIKLDRKIAALPKEEKETLKMIGLGLTLGSVASIILNK